MGYYVKVTKEVAARLLSEGVAPTMTADGCVVLWQSELAGVEGVNLNERVKAVGGALLTAEEAKAETDGTDNGHSCHTPAAYGGSDEEERTEAGDGQPTEPQKVAIPSVEADPSMTGQMPDDAKEGGDR